MNTVKFHTLLYIWECLKQQSKKKYNKILNDINKYNLYKYFQGIAAILVFR